MIRRHHGRPRLIPRLSRAGRATYQHQWVEVDKKPSWAFRKKKLGIANDVMVFVGLILVGYAYVWAKGGLNVMLSPKQHGDHLTEARS